MTIVIPAMSIDQQRVEICPLGVDHDGIIGKESRSRFLNCVH